MRDAVRDGVGVGHRLMQSLVPQKSGDLLSAVCQNGPTVVSTSRYRRSWVDLALAPHAIYAIRELASMGT